MTKKELLELIKNEQNKIENMKDDLDERLDKLIEIKKSVLLLIPDDIVYDDKWVDEQEAKSDILRKTSHIKEAV